jgi:hypothetical protein
MSPKVHSRFKGYKRFLNVVGTLHTEKRGVGYLESVKNELRSRWKMHPDLLALQWLILGDPTTPEMLYVGPARSTHDPVEFLASLKEQSSGQTYFFPPQHLDRERETLRAVGYCGNK